MPKNKSTSSKSAIFILFALVCFIAAACAWGDVYGFGGQDEPVTVEIPEGAGSADVAKLLEEKGVIRYSIVWRIHEKLGSSHDMIQLGEHVLTSSMSYNEIYNQLCQVVTYDEGIKVLIPEGSEIRQIIDILEEKKLIDREIFIRELNGNFDYPFMKYIKRTENRLEGYLFPATYTFMANMTERQIIEAMLSKFNDEFTQEMYERATKLNLTPDEVVILASIIEREAQGDKDRDLVSSVFWNRIKSSDMKYLQSCATVQYILKERKAVLSYADIEIKSSYNTYIIPGLPIGPIASPGKASLKAALYPATSDYYYFVVGKSGEHIFSRTLAEHNAAQQ